jgi:cytochrome c biogenesis protein CcdA
MIQEIKYNFMYGFTMVFLSISVLISLKTILHNLNWNNPVSLIQYHIMLIMITGIIKLIIKLKLSYVTFQQFNEIKKKIDIKFSAHDAFLE